MANFPTSLPVADTITAAQTLAEVSHASRHNVDKAEVRAIAEKVGINGSTDATSHDFKVTDHAAKLADVASGKKAETSANKDTDTALAADSDTKYPSQKAIKAYVDSAIAAAKAALYPVGSIYTNATDATNPGTLLGFGTWAAFGAGRVLVGIDAVQTEFDAAGETGGAKTHTLTEAEMPAHNHDGAGGFETLRINTSGPLGIGGGTNVVGLYNQTKGSGAAHNNLQPYVVVYLWRRTA